MVLLHYINIPHVDVDLFNPHVAIDNSMLCSIVWCDLYTTETVYSLDIDLFNPHVAIDNSMLCSIVCCDHYTTETVHSLDVNLLSIYIAVVVPTSIIK